MINFVNSSKSLAIAMAVSMVGCSAVMASSVSSPIALSGTASGAWVNVDGETGDIVAGECSHTPSGECPNFFSGEGTNRIQWGEPVLRDEPLADSQANVWSFTGGTWSADVGSPFLLGTFTYQNGDVYQDSYDFRGADLQVNLGFTGVLSSVVFDFGFDLVDTLNTCADPATCREDDDSASLVNNISERVFAVGDSNYTLRLLGFQQPDGSFLSAFSVPEDGTRSAALYGEIALAPVPLPAAGWLLLAGIGGLGLMRRRQARDAA